MADALSLGATYSRPKGGRVPSPLGAHARPLSLLAAFFSHILMQRGLRFGALEKRCAGPRAVRPCLPPVGRAQDFG